MKLVAFVALTLVASVASAAPPNVIVIMTDDQGYGDLGCHGAPVVETPNLDAMSAASARLSTFYVHPVCTPTRAALMTGRVPQRTRAIDTWISRAMLEPDEVTIAEVLRDAGYATGIFGKWHLGDCHPMRPIDQGFDTALVHRGGGIGQPADPEGGEGKYTDAVLFRDGVREETTGYCTDVYFEEAIAWIDDTRETKPFFAYVATNAPHTPIHDVPEELRLKYDAMGVSDFDARVFAMIENIDQNVGKLMTYLRETDLERSTLVIYMHDNGPNGDRSVGDMRGRKGQVFEGGVRSPFFAHWPGTLEPGVASDDVTAHVDVFPTILEACEVTVPDGVEIDGRSAYGLLRRMPTNWPERDIVIQAHRGNVPVRYHHMLLRTSRWKLLNASGFGKAVESVEPNFELYDMLADPKEEDDLAAAHPEIVAELRARYDAWFDEVGASDPANYTLTPITVGGAGPDDVHLTRQDWRVESGNGWGSIGGWLLRVEDAGPWNVRVRFLRDAKPEGVEMRIADVAEKSDVANDATDHTFEAIELPVGTHRIEVRVTEGETITGAYQVIIERAP